ncbi:NAC domain-containing protein 82-like isoform X2 [Lotus japonicus]|nr:NAC domain-containing protein 82-like isoform X2 [Lotus japonicus]XP_057418619.1 NAC domain-containing protein 82-like isoform X2 [Lotus japonicus]
MYFLKRKILGRKFPFDVIAELDIYKYAPWDLPDKSVLKTGDLKWYFFCPRGMKYSTGGKLNRATEFGYWKTTGKDRSVEHKNQVVGMIRTLVFHIGRAPKGDRTDWVMHEFRIEHKDLADKGIPQDSYVICRVFQKEGPGPRNGAQYGKPFNEEDWDEDEEIDSKQSMPVATTSAPGPVLPTASLVAVTNDMHTSPSVCMGLTSELCLSGLVPSCSTHPSAPNNQVDKFKESDNTNYMHASPSGCMGLTSESCLSGLVPSCSTHPSAPNNQVDEFKEYDNTLSVNDYNGNEKVDHPDLANNAEGGPYQDPNEIFGELGDLDSLLGLGEADLRGDPFSRGQEDECTTNEMLSTSSWFCGDGDFLELIDLDS